MYKLCGNLPRKENFKNHPCLNIQKNLLKVNMNVSFIVKGCYAFLNH